MEQVERNRHLTSAGLALEQEAVSRGQPSGDDAVEPGNPEAGATNASIIRHLFHLERC
jgi:hypothetical protein